MRVIERPLGAALLLEQARHHDARGSFARIFCRQLLAEAGIMVDVVQANVSHSQSRYTLRGLHLQHGRSAEIKVVQCLRGALFDVIVDLRPDSPTYCAWRGFELTADNGRVLVVPEGFAHGFLSLTPDVLLAYLVSAPYDPVAERGYRYDDPAFGIDWPHPPAIISTKDLDHAPFTIEGGATQSRRTRQASGPLRADDLVGAA
jgi:dTDP-4-dehydrorhamnose 3,5-epimerase